MEKVSVIIAVYNVENYLERCLKSVISQTYKHLEIICINNCSTDNSLDVLYKFSQLDSRIKIINNPNNLGLATSRNIGIMLATGDYIYYVDGDDWIEPDYIECFLKAALKTRTNLVVNTSIIAHCGNGKIPHMPDKTFNYAQEVFIDAKKAIYNLIWNTWAHFWKRAFLLEINARFPDGYPVEDIYFQAVTYLNLDSVYVIRKSAYHYTIRPGSLITTPEIKFLGVLDSLNLAYDYLLANKFHEKYGIKLLFDHILYPKNVEQINKITQYLTRIKDYILKHENLYTERELEIVKKYTTDKNTKTP